MVKLEIDGEILFTTLEHPFFIKGQWKKASDLRPDDWFLSFKGTLLSLKKLTVIDTLVKVYNFTVEDEHNYFVGENGVLAHNNNPCAKIAGRVIKQTAKKVDYLFANRNEAMNWARKQLGHNTTKMYDASGKWIGWSNSKGSVYWGHGDWGKGVGSSTFPHLNYNIGGVKGHLFLQDKIINRGMLGDFKNYFGL